MDKQMPEWDFAHVQDDVISHSLRMLECTFLAWHALFTDSLQLLRSYIA